MAEFGMEILGDKEIEKQLRSLPKKLQSKVLRQTMRNAAKPVLAEVKSRLSSIRVTGETTDPIRRKMKIRAIKARRGSGRIGVQIITPTRAELGITDSKWYPPAHIELGTKRTPPQPYLRNSLKTLRTKTEQQIAREIKAGIEKVTRGA